MVEITATFSGGQAIENALKKLPGAVAGRALRQALARAARPIRDEARGTLKSRGYSRGTVNGAIIRIQRNPTPHSVKVSIGYKSTTFWLGFLEDGTPPHRIFVKNSKVLGFINDSGEWVTWGRFFQHPGQKMNPWLRPAFDSKHDEAQRRFGIEIWESISRAAEKLRAR